MSREKIIYLFIYFRIIYLYVGYSGFYCEQTPSALSNGSNTNVRKRYAHDLIRNRNIDIILYIGDATAEDIDTAMKLGAGIHKCRPLLIHHAHARAHRPSNGTHSTSRLRWTRRDEIYHGRCDR